MWPHLVLRSVCTATSVLPTAPEAPMCLEAASLGRMRLCIGLTGSSLNWREVKHVIQGFVRSAGSVVSLDFIAPLLL